MSLIEFSLIFVPINHTSQKSHQGFHCEDSDNLQQHIIIVSADDMKNGILVLVKAYLSNCTLSLSYFRLGVERAGDPYSSG